MTALVSEPQAPIRLRAPDARGGPCRHTGAERRENALQEMASALDDLACLGEVRKLVQAAPRALCRLGFHRAMISRVEEGQWVVERFHDDTSPDQGARLTEAAQQVPLQLGPTLIEVEMVRRRIAILVRDTACEPRVSEGLRTLTGSHSYVAAPILPEGQVIGFFHADRPEGAPLDDFDRQLVALFAQQFGVLVHKALLTERIAALRGDVDRLLGSLGGAVSECLSRGVELVAPILGTPVPAQRALPAGGHFVEADGMHELLSAREREVLRLMALGETNTRIASRLVISEGTVKSHVRHILRKLGAANRAEAVCRWLQRPGGDAA